MNRKPIHAGTLAAALWLILALFAWFGPRQETSLSERRKLAQMPAFSVKNVESGKFMTDFEAFTQDQFPLREGFRQLKARFAYRLLRQKDNHGIYLVGNQAVKLEYPLNQASVESAAEKFGKIYEQYLKGNCENIVFSVVPDKAYYLAEKAGAPSLDYETLFTVMEQLPWARYADLTGSLTGEDYYGTDSHWRQERLIPGAQVLARALGTKAPEAGDFRRVLAKEDFRGVYYGQAALPLEPEPVYLLESDLLQNCTVYNYETDKHTSVYDLEKLESRDPYEVFLSGAAALLTVENPAGEPGKELVVFRDSFGSSMVPLLLAGYEKVTLVDIRYLPADYLGEMLDFHGQDILFLYSTTVLNNSSILR